MSSSIPIRLKDGEVANYYNRLEENNYLNNIARDFLTSYAYSKLRSHFIKVIVDTSIGVTFEEKIEKGLRKRLVQAAMQLQNKR